jgi:hypothetical protein
MLEANKLRSCLLLYKSKEIVEKTLSSTTQ